MKKFIPLLFCLFFIGCATTEFVRQDTEIWKIPEVFEHIERYVKTYGEPKVAVHAINYMTGDEYVELFWKIEEKWYKVVIYKDMKGWKVTEDWLKRYLIK